MSSLPRHRVRVYRRQQIGTADDGQPVYTLQLLLESLAWIDPQVSREHTAGDVPRVESMRRIRLWRCDSTRAISLDDIIEIPEFQELLEVTTRIEDDMFVQLEAARREPS